MEARHTVGFGGGKAVRGDGKRQQMRSGEVHEAAKGGATRTTEDQQERNNRRTEEEQHRWEERAAQTGMNVTRTLPSTNISREEMSKTLPRHMNAATMSVIPPSQKRGPLPTFPNPFVGQEKREEERLRQEKNGEKVPRHKTPYSPIRDIPPTPPLNLPIATQPFGSRLTGSAKRERKALEDEADEEDSSRWSSGESTPTPTASSVAAASARRRLEAKTMKPVTLTLPSHSKVQQSSRPQERPLSGSPIKLSDGREIATIRTDFANLTKVSRPASDSQNVSTSTQGSKRDDRKGKGKAVSQQPKVQDSESASATIPPTPIVRQEKIFQALPSSQPGSEADLSLLEAQKGNRKTFGPDSTLFTTVEILPIFSGPSQPPRMSIVKEEDETALASHPSRRDSAISASLRRSSFESGTTALNTPNIEERLSIEMGEGEAGQSRLNSKRGILSALVAPPSDVPEMVEPRSTASGIEGGGTDQRVPTNNSFSTQLEQLQRFVVNTKDDQRPDTGNRSAFSHIIPIVNLMKTNTRRPGTGQTRFSDAISIVRSRRLPSGHGTKPSCRQCFRAGFDCAMNLQLGEGTAGRKAFQDFVASGGLEAMSIVGAEEREGSITASQVLGRNYIEKLGEVAFGESALSRPVTRGVVNEMLEERSRFLTQQQKQKTVEDFLSELNSIKVKQDQEDELEAIKQQEREIQASGRKSSLMTRPTGVTSTEVEDERDSRHSLRQQDGRIYNNDDNGNDDIDAASSASSDQLPFLADRWSIWRKVVHITVLGLWIFALQCLDSGYNNSLPFIVSSLGVAPASMFTARLAFLVGQGAGFMFGAGLSCYGRYRIPLVMVVVEACICVIAGFAKVSVVLTILRGLSGFLGGVFEVTALGVILDIMITRRQRCIALVYLLTFVVAGQLSGPWIANLVISLISWPWLYWILSIFAIVYCALYGIMIQETTPESIYRESVTKLRLQNDQVWTPEPRPLPTIKSLVRNHLLRPYIVTFTHGIVILSALVLAIFLGSLVLAIEGIGAVLVTRHHMTTVLANVMVTGSAAIGGIAAIVILLLFSPYRLKMGREEGKSRNLFIDEKGFIDSSRPSHNAEHDLRLALAAVIAGVVALYTLALTASTTTWIFSALSLAILCAATVILATSIFNYLFESYYPAASTVLGELLAISDHLGPAPLMSRLDPREAQSISSSSEDEYTLMSGGDENGKRWNAQWALCVVASVVNITLFVIGVMTLVGGFANGRLAFSTLMIIAASVCLGGSTCLVVLYRYGDRMRHAAFGRIARTEQAIWKRDRRNGSSTEDDGSRSHSYQSPINRNISIPPTKSTGAKLREFLLPKRRPSTQAPAATISHPFNFVHIATGNPSPPTPILSRRPTMQGDVNRAVVASGRYSIEKASSPLQPAASPSPSKLETLRNDIYHTYDHHPYFSPASPPLNPHHQHRHQQHHQHSTTTRARAANQDHVWPHHSRQESLGGVNMPTRRNENKRWYEV